MVSVSTVNRGRVTEGNRALRSPVRSPRLVVSDSPTSTPSRNSPRGWPGGSARATAAAIPRGVDLAGIVDVSAQMLRTQLVDQLTEPRSAMCVDIGVEAEIHAMHHLLSNTD